LLALTERKDASTALKQGDVNCWRLSWVAWKSICINKINGLKSSIVKETGYCRKRIETGPVAAS
jgi:hypothetical protein